METQRQCLRTKEDEHPRRGERAAGGNPLRHEGAVHSTILMGDGVFPHLCETAKPSVKTLLRVESGVFANCGVQCLRRRARARGIV